MRSPAAAIAWEFRQRHRWGLIAVAGYMLALGTIRLLILDPGRGIDFEDAPSFALAVVVPLASTFMYFLAVFSFGLSGDLAARQSMYPARMLTLPVTSAGLAGWPMLYGAAAIAILWFTTRFLAVWPARVEVPIVWPALLAASLLAWTQALTWTSYPLRGLRAIVTVLWLIVIDAAVMVALELKAPEPVMLAILAPHVPLAYLVARLSVARARRGDVPDWRQSFARLGRFTDVQRRRRGRFSSAAHAQAWFEWRRFGRSLPALVGILLPFELALLFVFSDTPAIVFETLLGVLLTPPFMAAFVAPTAGKSNQPGRDSYGVTPFMATRPLTSASLVAAKLKAATWSTLAAWLPILVAIPIALRWSGSSPTVVEWKRQLIEAVGTPRAVAIVLLGVAALVAATWKQLVQSLYISMSGREWIVKSSALLALSLLAFIVPLAHRIAGNKAIMAALWTALPLVAALLALLKTAAAAWIAVRLRDRRLLSDRTLLVGAACWNVSFLALYGLLLWIVPRLLLPAHFLAFIAIIEIPLVRLSAAPLAFAWNRNR